MLSLLLLISSISFAAPPVGDVTLEWVRPVGWTPTNSGIYKLYGSPTLSIPMTNWTVLTNISLMSTSTTVHINPGQYFFAMTQSNLWGESIFSIVVSTPPLPDDVTLTIKGVK